MIRAVEELMFWTVLVVALAVVIMLALTGINHMSRRECLLQWEDSGYRVEYRGALAGCMVQRPNGRWVPASAMRALLPE